MCEGVNVWRCKTGVLNVKRCKKHHQELGQEVKVNHQEVKVNHQQVVRKR